MRPLEENPLFLVFDFDGTLADTRIAFREAFDEAARIMDVRPFRRDDEDYLRTLEASDVLHAHGIAQEQFADFTHLLKQGMERRHSQIRLIPGIAEALAQLASLDTSLGLITSNSEVLVRAVLEGNSDLFRYMHFDVSMRAKDAALKAAASEGSSFGDLHYVGDEIRDFRAASTANVRFSAVTWGFNTEAALRKEGCQTFIRNPAELLLITQ